MMSDELETGEGAADSRDADDSQPQVEAPSGAAAIVGPFFNAIVAPAQTWEALDAKPILSMWIVLWIAVFSTAMSIYSLPISQRIMAQSTIAAQRAQGQEFTPEQMQQTVDVMATVATVFAYASSVLMLVIIAFTALLIWVLASIMGGTGTTYGRAFAVAAGAAVIRPLVYSVYATVILNMNPPEIRRPQDAATIAPTLGLDLLLVGPDTPLWLTAIYQRVDLFQLWWLVLVVSGSMAVLKLKKGQAITLGAILWVAGTLFAVAMAMLQGLNAG